MDFYERYEALCSVKGIAPCSHAAAEQMGTSTATISYWKKGTKPTIDRIRAAADMLDTSADYLLGRTDNPVSIDELVDGVTPHEQELLNAYRAMSPQEQQMVCRMVGIEHPDEKQKKEQTARMKEDARMNRHEQELLAAYRTLDAEQQRLICRTLGISMPEENNPKGKVNVTWQGNVALTKFDLQKQQTDAPDRRSIMSKRLRARVNLGRDKQGKPVYKWASAYSQEELDAEIARIHQEYDRAHHRRKPAKASASPVEPSRVPNDQIPVPDIGASPSPLSVPSCPTPGADSRHRKSKTPVKGSASPIEPSRVPDAQIPVPDAGSSPSPLSVPPCPTPAPDSSADATQATPRCPHRRRRAPDRDGRGHRQPKRPDTRAGLPHLRGVRHTLVSPVQAAQNPREQPRHVRKRHASPPVPRHRRPPHRRNHRR